MSNTKAGYLTLGWWKKEFIKVDRDASFEKLWMAKQIEEWKNIPGFCST